MRAFLVLLLVAAATAKLAPLHKNREPIPGKYIVKLKNDFNLDEVVSTVRVSGGRVGNLFRRALHGFAAELSDKVVEFVRQLPAVEYVEEDGVYRTQETWGLDRVDQRSLPLDNVYSPSMGTGLGREVWVIDTGVLDTHVEFGGRAQQTANFANAPNRDCNGHGTHCSGTVGSLAYGVAKRVQIRGVKVLGCLGSGSTSGIVSGCDYVIANADIGNAVASMSLGGGASLAMDNAVANMVAAGIPTAVAAGNENQNACNVSPARESSAITVGATDINDARSSFSNWGSCVDIFAPGTDITSTWKDSTTDTKTISGTSMACPHVAGGLTLYGGSESAMLSAASSNKISGVMGSPNKLLYV